MLAVPRLPCQGMTMLPVATVQLQQGNILPCSTGLSSKRRSSASSTVSGALAWRQLHEHHSIPALKRGFKRWLPVVLAFLVNLLFCLITSPHPCKAVQWLVAQSRSNARPHSLGDFLRAT